MSENLITSNRWTIANAVTAVRIVLSPVLVVLIFFHSPSWWVLALAIAALVTDTIDGRLARKYGVSALGIFLDPLADKIIVIGAFGALVVKGWVHWLPVLVMALREVIMSVYRARLVRESVAVPARTLGKWKMVAQSGAIALAIAPGVMEHYSWSVNLMVAIAVLLSVLSLLQYMFDAQTAEISAEIK